MDRNWVAWFVDAELAAGQAGGRQQTPSLVADGLLHVLSGRLTLTVEDETHLVGPADTVGFAGDREHRYANEGDEQARLVMAVSTPLGS